MKVMDSPKSVDQTEESESGSSRAGNSGQPRQPKRRSVVGLVVDFLGSYGLATVLFLLLLLLTYLGTIEQVEMGLFETQKKYFDSLFLVHEFFGVPMLLPGVYLLLVILAVNLIVGGMIRLRKHKTTIGVLIAHFGILFMMFGGLVKFEFGEEGHMTLFENQRSNAFQSYHDWELGISKAGSGEEMVIGGDRFQDMSPNETRTFHSGNLPFDVTLSRYARNSQPMPKGPMFEVNQPVIDGFFLEPRPLETQAEQNIAGAYLTIKDKTTGAEQQAIVWGFSQKPLSLAVGQDNWVFDLRKKRTVLPFTIVLDKFHHEFHPGTRRPKLFMSEVTKIEDGNEQQYKIEMNQPLRHKGYTFYQSGWGPENAAPGQPLFSTFSVVRNPADQYPLIACVIVTLGLLVHFGQKLTRYLRAESKRSS